MAKLVLIFMLGEGFNHAFIEFWRQRGGISSAIIGTSADAFILPQCWDCFYSNISSLIYMFCRWTSKL